MAHPGRLEELNRKFDENPRRYFAPLANEYRKAGEFARAIELCRAYLPHQPGHMSGYIVYGQSLFDAGRGDEASEIFHQALNIDPENLIALRHLGDIAHTDGDKTLAMQWYQRVLELDPKNEEVIALIATLGIPGAPLTPPSPPKPPAVRPEPEPDPEAVALADLVEQPDTHQPPIEVASVFAYREESEQVFEIVHPEDQAESQEPEEEEEIQMASPFVTETMAALYAQQGFTAEALDVYRKLVAVRDEPHLHQKIRELEVRLADEADEYAPLAATIATAAPISELAPSATGGETVREFFARLGTRQPAPLAAAAPQQIPQEVTPTAAGLDLLFPASQVDARDAQAAASLAGAFSGSR